MKKFNWFDFVALVIFLLPAIYLMLVYSSLPEIVPLHYSIHGKVNRIGHKDKFLILQGFMLIIELLVYLLLRFIIIIDPKKKAVYSEETFRKIAMGLVVFLSAFNIVMIFSAGHQGISVTRFLFPMSGFLVAFTGNLMNNIKPNYFVGIRTPWTLESEDTWKATHRMAGKVWFAGGLILALLTLVLPLKIATVVFMISLTIIVLVPVIYSYFYFKKHQLSKPNEKITG